MDDEGNGSLIMESMVLFMKENSDSYSTGEENFKIL